MAFPIPLVQTGGEVQQLQSADSLFGLGRGAILFVDSVYGNDSNAQRNRRDRPFLTIGAAVAMATNGDKIVVGPGTFTETAVVQLPANVSLFGAGIDVTTLSSNVGIVSGHACFAPGNSSVITDLTVNSTTGVGAPLGWLTNDTVGTNVLLFRVKLVGISDGFYFSLANGSLTAFDCIVSSQQDCFYADVLGTFEFYNCIFASVSAAISAYGLNSSNANVIARFFNGKIDMSGTYAIGVSAVCNSGIIELHNMRINSPRDSRTFDLKRTGGSLIIHNVARVDGFPLNISGTIIRALDTPEVSSSVVCTGGKSPEMVFDDVGDLVTVG